MAPTTAATPTARLKMFLDSLADRRANILTLNDRDVTVYAADMRAVLDVLDDLRAEWTTGLVDGAGRHVPLRRDWPDLAKVLDTLVDLTS